MNFKNDITQLLKEFEKIIIEKAASTNEILLKIGIDNDVAEDPVTLENCEIWIDRFKYVRSEQRHFSNLIVEFKEKFEALWNHSIGSTVFAENFFEIMKDAKKVKEDIRLCEELISKSNDIIRNMQPNTKRKQIPVVKNPKNKNRTIPLLIDDDGITMIEPPLQVIENLVEEENLYVNAKDVHKQIVGDSNDQISYSQLRNVNFNQSNELVPDKTVHKLTTTNEIEISNIDNVETPLNLEGRLPVEKIIPILEEPLCDFLLESMSLEVNTNAKEMSGDINNSMQIVSAPNYIVNDPIAYDLVHGEILTNMIPEVTVTKPAPKQLIVSPQQQENIVDNNLQLPLKGVTEKKREPVPADRFLSRTNWLKVRKTNLITIRKPSNICPCDEQEWNFIQLPLPFRWSFNMQILLERLIAQFTPQGLQTRQTSLWHDIKPNQPHQNKIMLDAQNIQLTKNLQVIDNQLERCKIITSTPNIATVQPQDFTKSQEIIQIQQPMLDEENVQMPMDNIQQIQLVNSTNFGNIVVQLHEEQPNNLNNNELIEFNEKLQPSQTNIMVDVPPILIDPQMTKMDLSIFKASYREKVNRLNQSCYKSFEIIFDLSNRCTIKTITIEMIRNYYMIENDQLDLIRFLRNLIDLQCYQLIIILKADDNHITGVEILDN